MFSFFRSKESKDSNATDDDNILARISYVVKNDSKGVLIDIEIQDYDDESVAALSHLLDVLGEDNSYIDTINIIKTSFTEKGLFDVLIKIFANIHDKVKNKLLTINNSKTDKPCVKPSEIWSNMNLENRG